MDDKMPTRRRTGDLTSGPIPRTLLRFALPVLGSNVLQSLNGSINAVWVGRFLGEAALTATSNANLVLFLILGTVFASAWRRPSWWRNRSAPATCPRPGAPVAPGPPSS